MYKNEIISGIKILSIYHAPAGCNVTSLYNVKIRGFLKIKVVVVTLFIKKKNFFKPYLYRTNSNTNLPKVNQTSRIE